MRRGRKQKRIERYKRSIVAEILGVLLILFSIVLVLSLISFDPKDPPNSSLSYEEVVNYLGPFGAYLSSKFLTAFGFMSYGLALLFALWGWTILRSGSLRKVIAPTVLISVFSLWATLMTSLTLDYTSYKAALPFPVGGIFGLVIKKYILLKYMGEIGAFLIPTGIFIVVVLLTTPLSVRRIVLLFEAFFRLILRLVMGFGRAVFSGFHSLFLGRKKVPSGGRPDIRRTRPQTGAPESPVAVHREDQEKEAAPEIPEPAEEPPEIGIPVRKRHPVIVGETTEKPPVTFRLPPIDLLNEPTVVQTPETEEEMLTLAEKLRENLGHFGVDAKVLRVSPGPVITRYEVKPAPGVKVGRIANLADDLALALHASRIRILTPIPGLGAVGIEVPNRNPQIVYLREIIESEVFRDSPSLLQVAIGKTTAGEPYSTDLRAMPHLLIAGSTGSGKSVCINCLITSLIFRATPREVRFILIDPKMLELPIYNKIPHLLTPVITDVHKASECLQWAVKEMERRYQILATHGTRDIDQYNKKVIEMVYEEPEDTTEGEIPLLQIPETLPYIVIIIDELADLMLMAATEVEESLMRLAQMARAVGIHLVLATQRPSVDVITGVIKANFPSRLSFQVPSKTDSRTILDFNGAEKLLGRGDMLFIPPGTPEPIRLHGAYISAEESERIVRFLHEESGEEILELEDIRIKEEDFGDFTGMKTGDRDELFEDALRLVVRHQQGSISLLQRRLKVGYSRAARLIDELEDAGIVGPFDGSKAREVLVDENYLERFDRGEVSL